MDTVLVVVTDDTPAEQLIDLANTFATGTDTEILVYTFIDEAEYQQQVKDASKTSHQPPTTEAIETEAVQPLRDIASFTDDVTYSLRAEIGPLPDEILTVAEKEQCDHVVIGAKRRSPAGKVLFRDITQSVLLNFDGPVTVQLEN